MKLNRLDHVNIRTSNLSGMIEWYARVLNINSGARPNFDMAGAWLYLGEDPIVHLVATQHEPANEQPKIEHFAIKAEGFSDFTAHLDQQEIAYRTGVVPGLGVVQVNIFDPDGNHIHIDFAQEDAGDLAR